MRVSYKWIFRSWLEGYRVGLSYLTLSYRLVWGGILLLVLGGLVITEIGRGYPSTWPPTGLPPRTFALHIGSYLGVYLTGYLTAALAFGYFTRSRAIHLLSRHLAWKTIWSSRLIRWKDITDIVQTSDYVFFCQNVPSAIVVPKSAFRTQAQVTAFVEEAERYWRRETGRNDVAPAENIGVWPPAPHVDDSQEKA